jgi:hypothetical protein
MWVGSGGFLAATYLRKMSFVKNERPSGFWVFGPDRLGWQSDYGLEMGGKT